MSALWDLFYSVRGALVSGLIFRPKEALISLLPWAYSPNRKFHDAYVQSTPAKDLLGKVVVVTGGNSGLGREAVLQFARRGAHVIIAARNLSKANDAMSEVQSKVENAKLSLVRLDLSSLASIDTAAQIIKSLVSRLDILMNNAGVASNNNGATTDGIELSFGVSYVGAFHLTKLLLPLLQKTSQLLDADVRIVNLSSVGHNESPPGGIVFSQAQQFKLTPLLQYTQSKLANLLFTRELARRYPEIRSVAVHPGLVRTELLSNIGDQSPSLRFIYTLFDNWMVLSVPDGCLTQVLVSTSTDIKSGAYYIPFGIEAEGSLQSRDVDLARRLWKWTENLIESKQSPMAA